MLIGYVSDERYVALAGVALEFEREGRSAAVVRSTPRGAVYADIEPGEYRVTLVRSIPNAPISSASYPMACWVTCGPSGCGRASARSSGCIR